jgi:hypothetical protein
MSDTDPAVTHLEKAVAHLTPALADQPQSVAAVKHARQNLALQTLHAAAAAAAAAAATPSKVLPQTPHC